MLGFVGIAPAHERFHNGWAGYWGGNFDAQEVCPGAAVQLAVNVPGALLQIGDEVTQVVAERITDPQTRERIWAQMIDTYPGYAMYRSKAGRDIKVFVVRPSPEGATLVG